MCGITVSPATTGESLISYTFSTKTNHDHAYDYDYDHNYDRFIKSNTTKPHYADAATAPQDLRPLNGIGQHEQV